MHFASFARMSFALLSTALLAVFGQACSSDVPSSLPPPPSGTYDLAGTDQTMSTDDLKPLLPIVGSATDVGLGESIHTSGGFQAMKARLVRFLVQEAGFRVLAIESPRTAAQRTGHYVATCEGTPTDAAKYIFSVFASDSMRDLLEWLCNWNRTHVNDPVQFVGFDEQQPWVDHDALRTYLPKVAASEAASLLAGLQTCDGAQGASEDDYYSKYYNDPYPQASFDACEKGLDALDAYFTANADAMRAVSSLEAFTLGKLSAVGLRAWQGQRFHEKSAMVESMESRDLAMAAIYAALRALYFPQSKAILWAHNYHLMSAHPEAEAAGSFTQFVGARNMGSVLAHDLGSAYAPIGLSGWDVEINWPGVGQGRQGGVDTAPKLNPQGVEWKLHDLGHPLLLVDFHDPRLGSLISPGAKYAYGFPQAELLVPADQFRAGIYFESSPPMQALFW